MPNRFILKLRVILRGTGGDKNVTRIQRRRKLGNLAWRLYPKLQILLLLVGYAWMLTIPSSLHVQRTYIDENALQPAQVNTYWNWGDVHRADLYLEELEALRDCNASSHEIATFLSTEFRKLGIPAAMQEYTFDTRTGAVHGMNAYAVLSSPRASGTEAIVVSASRRSQTGEPNLRGVATVLSLAAYLKGSSLWAKDLVFVVSDGHLDGMQAWITAYHGVAQSNLVAEPLQLASGVIWTALNIDYPGHSFSHLGVFFEGLNGRLPNQDLINSVQRIAQYTGGVPMLVYDHKGYNELPNQESAFLPRWLPDGLRQTPEAQEYAYRAENVVRHVGFQARGRASGVHGLLHQFRIDAITLFALPAHGPHGFHAIGRVVESTLRTANNLLERLHASFFFYLLVGPTTFIKIGGYLPSALLVSVAMLFGGMGAWAHARWIPPPPANEKQEQERWIARPRPLLPALFVVCSTHALGAALFFVCATSFACAAGVPSSRAPDHLILKTLNLCLASTVVSVTSVLNFSLAATLAIALGFPLSFSTPSSSAIARLGRFTAYASLALGWLFMEDEVTQALLNWELLGVWFAPFVCIMYTPLVLQAGIVCLLSP
ncbi:hypothetical protein PHLGIDRAFT_21074 [Phlebiopsis gigantea 11061_1 CR5-6]|uniref:Gaa1-domain-containing protein n=1 Tax=Phlebiopsis gigantea (strain 11061_1 CR5-6) TaxID=745531 RepID=A0A0C3S767_PHLG1|nr:hypothetical protein PHLGIDRAFT_21074 [Phlebiopsis gigantea 11061_1 CR5-6]